ncbi:MAG: PQQ-dependent sugar dehydrogenase [Deltaproteobacteria bacterium]|nr:PQQ-dependent sugar dehydrogenase [Deltaproteobacteria bacterium]
MRTLALLLALAAACGGGHKAKDDAPIGGGHDGSGGGSGSGGCTTPPAVPVAACTPVSGTTVAANKIGQVSGGAMLATSPPNDGRLFVVEQGGRIRIFQNEQIVATPFLDISGDIVAGGEQGLLGLAFDPDYACNGYFYVWYTLSNADVLARFTVSSDPNKADAASKQVLLSIPDFATNHNGGMLEFGADGFLYIGTGDGGGGGDPHRNGQAIDRTAASCTSTQCEPLLGKILRIDPAHPANGKPYGIPADNPFANGGGEPEIFIIGTRNPWRWSFDRQTGDLWIGDVGQDVDEELDVLPAGQQVGKNLGWSMYEANRNYGNYTPDPNGKTFPQLVKNHTADGWHAIIGGQVYRGPCYPDLAGKYFFTDNTASTMSVATYSAGTVTSTDLAGTWPSSPASIHADARGELYETTTNGSVYHITAGP